MSAERQRPSRITIFAYYVRFYPGFFQDAPPVSKSMGSVSGQKRDKRDGAQRIISENPGRERFVIAVLSSRATTCPRFMPLYIPSTPSRTSIPFSPGPSYSFPYRIAPPSLRHQPIEIFIEKIEKCADFFVFSFPCSISVLQIRSFYSTLTHSLPTGLSNTQ